MEKYIIPKHLDDPPNLLLWPLDEAMIFVFPFVIGILLGVGLFGVIFSFVIFKLWKKIKKAGGAHNFIKA